MAGISCELIDFLHSKGWVSKNKDKECLYITDDLDITKVYLDTYDASGIIFEYQGQQAALFEDQERRDDIYIFGPAAKELAKNYVEWIKILNKGY